jgi:3',5'-cyclic AMP phosphodiesterase CpdA
MWATQILKRVQNTLKPILNIIQVSDTHLSRDWGYFQGNWDAFIDAMQAERPDFIFITGDMCFNGAKNTDDLAYARSQLDRLPAPWRAIPGNHDIGDTPPDPRLKGPITAARRTRYRQRFGPDFWSEDLGEWRFIGLNAQLMDSGLPTEQSQMTHLGDALAGADGRAIALLIHKPLYVHDAGETGRSLSGIWPKSRKRLLSLCKQHHVKLVASGHRHCYRSTRHEGTRLIWAPPTSFINSLVPSEGVRLTRRVGYVRYRFQGRTFRHELVEPPRFINHDVRNWMSTKGSTTKMPLLKGEPLA